MTWASIREAWRRFWASRYVKALEETNAALEEENAALRKDNRALVNAQLQQAGAVGLPDMPVDPLPATPRLRRFSHHQRQVNYAARTTKEAQAKWDAQRRQ